jgi:hypothetical protein
MVTFNFDKKEQETNRDFSLVPEGIYDATIEDVEERTSRSGNRYKKLTFRLFGDRAEKENVARRMIWDNLVLLEQVEWKIQNLLYACGLPYEGTVTLSDNWSELIGKELKLGIGIGEYQAQKRNEVKNYYTSGTRVIDANQSEDKISDNSEESSGKKSRKKAESPKKNDFEPSEEEEINIEDIPF